MNLFAGRNYSTYQSTQAQISADAAQRDAREAQENVEFMRQDINRLLLITEALWMLLKQQHGYTDEDLTKVVTEIDLRDGVADGKANKVGPKPCPYCGRMVAAHHATCIFCGQAVPLDLFGR